LKRTASQPLDGTSFIKIENYCKFDITSGSKYVTIIAMNNLFIIRLAKILSITGLVTGVTLCSFYYFNKDAELATFAFFYLQLAGIVGLLLVLLLVFHLPGNGLRRKKLLSALAFVISSYAILWLVAWLTLRP